MVPYLSLLSIFSIRIQIIPNCILTKHTIHFYGNSDPNTIHRYHQVYCYDSNRSSQITNGDIDPYILFSLSFPSLEFYSKDKYFNTYRVCVNFPLYVCEQNLPLEWLSQGKLKRGITHPNMKNNSTSLFDNLADYYDNSTTIEMRIPWALLGFTDPSTQVVFDYWASSSTSPPRQKLSNPNNKNSFRLQLFQLKPNQVSYTTFSPTIQYSYSNWTTPTWHTRKKESFDIVRKSILSIRNLPNGIPLNCSYTVCQRVRNESNCISPFTTTDRPEKTTDNVQVKEGKQASCSMVFYCYSYYLYMNTIFISNQPIFYSLIHLLYMFSSIILLCRHV